MSGFRTAGSPKMAIRAEPSPFAEGPYPDRHNPLVRIFPLTDMPGVTEELLRERLISLNFTDTDKAGEPPSLEMEFADPDETFFRLESIAIGGEFRVTLGYPGDSFVRDFVIRRVKALYTRQRKGTLTLEGRSSEIDKIHRHAGPTFFPLPKFTEMKVTDAVRFLAHALGFLDGSMVIEEENWPGEPDVVSATTVTFLESETAAQFLSRQARALDYVWKIEGDKFRFHSPGFEEPPLPPIRYRGGADVLEFELDADFRIPAPGRVAATRANPRVNVVETTTVEGVTETAGILAIRDLGPFADAASAGTQSRANLVATDIVPASNVPNKARQQAVRRLQSLAERRWKLELKLVGNPRILAGRKLTLEGFGPWIDGQWFVRGVTHHWDVSGYTTTVKPATRRQPSSGVGKSKPEVKVAERTETASGQTEIAGILAVIP